MTMYPLRRRAMDLTVDHVARATRPVEAFAHPSFTRATSQDYAALVDRLLAERPEGPLHVFAYGSLLWKPAFEPVATRHAVARGWHRQFCIQLRGHRGTPETPGLMLALMSGGRCVGLALEVGAGRERRVVEDLCRRELPFAETMGDTRWLRLDTAEGPIRALTFWAGPRGSNIRRSLPLPVAAAQIARACGPNGSMAEYLHNTVHALEQHGIRDRNLWTIQRLVAQEIDTLPSGEVQEVALAAASRSSEGFAGRPG
jgi:cation transport protein ChaC